MIQRGFLDPESRQDLTELARDGSAAHRLARRPNALVPLDDGMSYAAVAKVLLLDDDTIRAWHRQYEEEGVEGVASFGYEGSACRLNTEQQDKLKAWITETLPRTTREIGAWIEKQCAVEYQSRSGLIALLHRPAWSTASRRRSRASWTPRNKPPLSRNTRTCRTICRLMR